MKHRISTLILTMGLCLGIAVPLTFAAKGQETMQSSKKDHGKMSHKKKHKKAKKSDHKMSKMHQGGKMGGQ